MDLSLFGKRALVCGASRGIGRSCAMELAALGATVLLVARSEAGLATVSRELSTVAGQQHQAITADLSRTSELVERISPAVSAQGGVDILINNAGGPPADRCWRPPSSSFRQPFRCIFSPVTR